MATDRLPSAIRARNHLCRLTKDQGGSAGINYALLAAALAVMAVAWLDMAVTTIDRFAPDGRLTIPASEGPTLCAGQLRPSPSGGEC